MGTDNFAYGSTNHQDVPWIGPGVGIKTDGGMIFPATARIAAYVRSTGRQDLDPPDIGNRIVTTLAAGLKMCRAGFGDVVVCLPGHTENVTTTTMMDNLVNGTRIIGWGSPLQDDAPVFNFTVTTAQWIMDNKNCSIQGLRIKMSAATTFVAKAIVFTAAGCSMLGNVIETATDSTHGALIAVELGTGADQFVFSGNYVFGTIGTFQTHVLKIVAAVLDCQIIKNTIIAPSTIATGVIAIGAVATLRIVIRDNMLANTLAASTACISFGAAAATGIIANNMMSTLADGNPASGDGMKFGAGVLVRCFQNFTTDEPIKSGMLAPAIVAT